MANKTILIKNYKLDLQSHIGGLVLTLVGLCYIPVVISTQQEKMNFFNHEKYQKQKILYFSSDRIFKDIVGHSLKIKSTQVSHCIMHFI